MPLSITRRAGESFTIGDEIEITLTRIKGNQVVISISAPKELEIKRDDMVNDKPKDNIGNH